MDAPQGLSPSRASKDSDFGFAPPPPPSYGYDSFPMDGTMTASGLYLPPPPLDPSDWQDSGAEPLPRLPSVSPAVSRDREATALRPTSVEMPALLSVSRESDGPSPPRSPEHRSPQQARSSMASMASIPDENTQNIENIGRDPQGFIPGISPVGARAQPPPSIHSEHSSGDAAGGAPREREEVKPALIGKGAEEGAGVGSLYADHEVPSDATFFSALVGEVEHGHTVCVEDGFGGTVTIASGEKKAFEVQLDSEGTFHWSCDNRRETTKAPNRMTNWIVAACDNGELSWSCYARTFGLPAGFVHLGHDTSMLKGSGPVVAWDGGENSPPIFIARGEDKAFAVKLDAQGYFRWRCDATEERTRPSLGDVSWIRAVHPPAGREITWTYYSTPDTGARAEAIVLNEAELVAKSDKGWKPPWKRDAPATEDMHEKDVQEEDFEEEEHDWHAHGGRGWLGFTCEDFPLCSIHCPCLFACIVLTLIVACSAVAWPGIEVDTNFDSFLEADSRANEVRVAFTHALDARGNAMRRLSSREDSSYESPGEARPENWSRDGPISANRSSRKLESAGNPAAGYWAVDPSVLHKVYKLEIMYRSRSDESLTSLKVLRQIRTFEARLREGSKWKRLCGQLSGETLRLLCEPGTSMVNILWPVNMDADKKFHMQASVQYNISGKGSEPLPVDAAFQLVDALNLRHALFPKAYDGSRASTELRSLFEFDLVVCSVSDTMAFRKEQMNSLATIYKAFISDELYPLLKEQAENDLASFDVNWKGDALDSYEVWDALMKDCLLALGSGAFIFIYLTCHTGSPLISAGALFLALISIPVAFVTAARLSGGNKITGAAFLSLFLIVGLGADVVLVFVSFFELSRKHFGKNTAQRVLFLYKHAGLACLATSLTTAASFFANLASVLKPLREFGFFMGLCIMDVYFLILVGLPPLLIMNERLAEELVSRGMVPWLQVDQQRQPIQDEEKAEGKTNHLQRFIGAYFDRVLTRFRRRLVAAFILVPIAMLVWTVSVVNVDGGMPQMFPDDHNQNMGKKVHARFVPIEEIWVEPSIYICNIGRVGPSHIQPWNNEPCALTWCHLGVGGPLVTHGHVGEESSECTCMPARENKDDKTCYESRDELNQRKALRIGSAVRFVGLNNVPASFWSSEEWKSYLKKAASLQNGVVMEFGYVNSATNTVMNLSTMVQEHWESGMIKVVPYMLAPDTTIQITAQSDESPHHPGMFCAPNEVCYCGTQSCKFRDESLIGPGLPQAFWTTLKVGAHSAAGGGRRLQDKSPKDCPRESSPRDPLAGGLPGHSKRKVLSLSDDGEVSSGPSLMHPFDPIGRRLANEAGGSVDVSLIWGLTVIGGTPLLGEPNEKPWEYDDQFRPDTPRAQRHLYKSCQDLKTHPELRVQSQTCWVSEFRRWLRGQNELWPARATRFRSLLAGFQQTGLLQSGVSVTDFMWFGDDGSLRAIYFKFDVALSYDATPSHVALTFMKKWTNVVSDLNANAPMDASKCWHTSRLWIRAEAEKAIVDSTLNTLMVSIGCGFLGTFCFTNFDMMLSGFVVLSVSGVTTCLAWFMCVVMQWPFGAVEVLGLIVFVGYSITYSLHIAHKYGEYANELEATHSTYTCRILAVRHALDQMSSAVAGSALTTLGSSFFLFFCTMAIFVKLAAVLFAVTFFACLFALVAVPSALLVAGPVGFCGFGAVRKWMDGESLDYDVEEPSHGGSGGAEPASGGFEPAHPHSQPSLARTGSMESVGQMTTIHSNITLDSTADSAGVFNSATRNESSSSLGGGSPKSKWGNVSSVETNFSVSRSEVFISAPSRGNTPHSSPSMRNLVALGALPPGPPTLAMNHMGTAHPGGPRGGLYLDNRSHPGDGPPNISARTTFRAE